MRIKSLYIKKYKNLSGKYSFENSKGYVALIGLNGSGKSNLLEAISIIFKMIYGLCPNNVLGDFYLEYEIEGKNYYKQYWENLGNPIAINMTQTIPSSLISCYSGEDGRLWELGYKDYYVDFFNKAIGGGEYKPKALYVNKYCWKIAFISLLFNESETVQHFIADTLKIDINNITVKFNEKAGVQFQNNDASNWYQRVIAEFGDSEINIEDLKTNENTPLNCSKYLTLSDDKIIFYYLYFLHMPEKNSAIGMNADKLIESIDIKINGYSFDDLSEGEKKLILIECITKILGDDNSLVLLDEPDAHTHIAMKKDLLKLIHEFKGQTIMTSHSPMFLNKRWDDYEEDNIFYMHDGKIENTEPLKHLADLTDNEIDYFEGSFILSSKNLLVVEGKYDHLYLKKAIEIFGKRDTKYNRLNDVSIMSVNGASAVIDLYNQLLSDYKDKMDKIVFLFDYDDAGWRSGWKKIDDIPDKGTVISPMFYQDNYSGLDYPTDDANIKIKNSIPANKGACIKSENSFMVEDLFSKDSYANIITAVTSARSHKDFRKITFQNGGTAGSIKNHIETNYTTFRDEWYDGFKPVLDKLLDVFDLN